MPGNLTPGGGQNYDRVIQQLRAQVAQSQLAPQLRVVAQTNNNASTTVRDTDYTIAFSIGSTGKVQVQFPSAKVWPGRMLVIVVPQSATAQMWATGTDSVDTAQTSTTSDVSNTYQSDGLSRWRLLRCCNASSTGGGGGSGTVTSVGLAAPAEFTVTGSPVTSAGTLTFSKASQSANQFWGSPNGASGAPSFRSLVNADLPTSGATAGTYGDATHVAQTTVNAQGIVTGISSVAITGPADADIPTIALAFQPGGAAVGWAIPSTVTEFLGLTIHRGKYDLTNATSARIIVDVSSSAGVTNTIAAQYFNGTSWVYLDGGTGPNVGFAGAASGIQDGGWFTLAAGAKADNPLRFVGSNSGGGTINFGAIYLQVK